MLKTQKGAYKMAEDPKLFWANVDVRDAGSCWPWKAGLYTNGYGSCRFGPKKWRAHRLAYVIANGAIDTTKQVMHTCDNKVCCNPEHLIAGTAQENRLDCVRKQRNGRTKITNELEAMLKAEYAERKTLTGTASHRRLLGKLAEKYDLSVSYTYKLIRGYPLQKNPEA